MEMEIMQRVSPAALPQIIRDHIAAYKNHDADAFMASLAPDALVNDVQREFLGHPAIRAWADKEIFGDNVTLEIEDSFQHGDGTIVRCRVDGDFEKANVPNPLILTFYFAVRDRKISQLIILHNKATAP
jgi:ketosteroid isomerase-like protein